MLRSLISSFILEAYILGECEGCFPAASLSLDLTGFTALTETLAQHGQAGSEALADALSALFAPLVRSIHAQGGFITQFAGDGFTALFPEQDAPGLSSSEAHTVHRALAAAQVIQHHLQAHPTCITPFGAFPLIARIGVARGEVIWGILRAGDGVPHAWYFSGPAITECICVQQGAAQGEVGVSEAVAAHEPGPVKDRPAPGETIVAGPAASADPGTLAEAAAAFLPATLGQLVGRGEFRNAVAVFLTGQDIRDRQALAAFMAILFEQQRRHGGFLSGIHWEGDRCTAVLFWGAPATHEGDVAQALNFVLDTQAQAKHPIRAGMTYRITYAGLVGAAERADYGCYGPGTNLAARMAEAAPWGELWLDEAIARRARAHFTVEPLRARDFKGFATPQKVYALYGQGAMSASARFTGAFIGRQHELAQLTSAVAPLRAGRPAGIIAISGEAGVGKSRLLAELRQALRAAGPGAEPLTGAQPAATWFHCPADEIRRSSLGPFRRLLRAWFEQTAATDAENARRFIDKMGSLIAATSDPGLQADLERGLAFLAALADLSWPDPRYAGIEPKARFDNTRLALQAFLLAESRIRPLILAVEDAHWLDADSEELLRTLSFNLGDAPLTIVLVSREPAALDHYNAALPRHELHLARLTEAELAALAQARLGAPAPPDLLALLQTRTEGNPFFAEQLLRHMQEQGLIGAGSGGVLAVAGAPSLPADVRGVLIARVDRLAPSVRDVVQRAAVLGREFETAVLAEFAPVSPAFDTQLAAAAGAGIWAPLDVIRYQFQHALLRDAVYDMQLHARLRQLHGMAAEALVRVHAANLAPYYGDLAYHYGQASDTPHERRYARLAGERAAAQYANAEAVAYLSRALALTPEDATAERYALLSARLFVYDLQGARAAQREDLDALAALADHLNDAAKRAEVAMWKARYAYLTGDYKVAVADAQRSLTLAPAGSATAARAYLVWGKAASWLNDYPAARTQLNEALIRSQTLGLTQVETDSWLNLGIVSYSQTDFPRARAEIAEALRLAQACGDRRLEGMALGTLGSIAFDQGDYHEAWPWYEQALRLNRQVGDRLNQGTSLGNLCNITLYQGHYDAARAYAEEALAIFLEVGALYGATVAYHVLGQIARNQGDDASAAAHYEQALRLARETEDTYEESEVLASLGLLHHQTGDHCSAERFCRAALAAVEALGEQHVRTYALTNLGHTLAALGDLAGAATAHRDALAIRRAAGEKTRALENLAGLAEIALTAGDLAQAQQHVEEILAHLATGSVDGAEEPLRIYLACYRVLQASSDPRAADILATAQRLLAERAGRIGDPALRRSYLEKAPVHRALASAGAPGLP